MANADRERLAELRQRVRARNRAATGKLSRLRRKNGADLRGTFADVRVDPKKIDRMNTPQLQAALTRLNGFMSRQKQYVGLGNGFVERWKWDKYVQAEKDYNKNISGYMRLVEKTKYPDSDASLKDNYDITHPKYDNKRYNKKVDYAIDYRNLKPTDVYSPDALDKLISNMNKGSKASFIMEKYNQAVKTFKKMVAASALTFDPDAVVEQMNPTQFLMAWDYGGLPRMVSVFVDSDKYHPRDKNKDVNDGSYSILDMVDREVDTGHNPMDDVDSQMQHNAGRQIDKIIQWAKNIKTGK